MLELTDPNWQSLVLLEMHWIHNSTPRSLEIDFGWLITTNIDTVRTTPTGSIPPWESMEHNSGSINSIMDLKLLELSWFTKVFRITKLQMSKLSCQTHRKQYLLATLSDTPLVSLAFVILSEIYLNFTRALFKINYLKISKYNQKYSH